MYEMEKVAESELEQVEISIEDAKKMIKYKDMLDTLRRSKAFKTVFLKLYLEEEAARLTTLLSAPGWQTEEAQADTIGQLRAISHFGQFMTTLNIAGMQAKDSLQSHEDTREEILAEELG